MADLIYLLCFGGPVYARMTELCVESLRRPGGFSGDILVFSDGSFTSDRTDTIICDVSNMIEINVQRIRAASEMVATSRGSADASFSRWLTGEDEAEDVIRKMAYKALKPEVAAIVDHARYDKIAYLDTDMIAIGDVDSLLRVSDFGVSAIEERQIGSSMLNESCGQLLLRPDEMAQARETVGICTGFICAKSTVFKQSMMLWLKAIQADQKRLNYWSDQPYFNVLVLRGKIPFEPLPETWVDNPPQYVLLHDVEDFHLRDDTKLLHFWWYDKGISLIQMELLNKALMGGATRKDLDTLLRGQLAVLREATVAWLNGRSLPEKIGTGASRKDLYALLRSRLESVR